jgi:hypothetical protein
MTFFPLYLDLGCDFYGAQDNNMVRPKFLVGKKIPTPPRGRHEHCRQYGYGYEQEYRCAKCKEPEIGVPVWTRYCISVSVIYWVDISWYI